MRGTYDNLYNRTRTRIDGRNQADPAVQAGMRKIHRGMDGSVIGGVTAEGSAIGTKRGAWANRGFADAPDLPPLGGAANPASSSVPAGRPNALGGGLSRWERLNPNAKPAFSAGSPANDKSTNRRLMRQQAAPAAGVGNLASRFVDAAMPKPSVPSVVPLGSSAPSAVARPAAMAKAAPASPVPPAAKTFAPFRPSGPIAAISSGPTAKAAPATVPAPPKAQPNRWADGTPIAPKAATPAPAAKPTDNRPVMSRWTPKADAAPKPDARHSNRLAARVGKSVAPRQTMTTREALESRLATERKASFAKEEAARAERVAAKKAAVTVPDWQKGTMLGSLNERVQRYAANFTR